MTRDEQIIVQAVTKVCALGPIVSRSRTIQFSAVLSNSSSTDPGYRGRAVERSRSVDVQSGRHNGHRRSSLIIFVCPICSTLVCVRRLRSSEDAYGDKLQ